MIRQRPKNVKIKQKDKDTKIHYKHEHKDGKGQKIVSSWLSTKIGFGL